MKNKIRIAFAVIKLLPYFIYCYFGWYRKYYKHRDKYPLELRYKKVRLLIIRIVKVLKLDIQVINLDYINNHKERYLGISNHRSSIDPLFYIYFNEKPISFISKVEAMKIPFAGKVIYIIDGFFIERDDLMSQVKLFKDVAKHMKEKNLSYFVFTEGTRIKDRDATHTLPYKDGSLKLAYWSESDIIYVVHYGSQYALKENKKGYKLRNLTFHVFKPLSYEEFKDKRTTEVMPIIQKESNDMLPIVAKLNGERNKK